jgi:hypothetical protein
MYAITRVKSLELGTDFGIMHPQKFKGMNFIDLDFGRQIFGGMGPEGGPPTELPIGIDYYYKEPILRHSITNQDITEIDPNFYDLMDGTKIDGNFQSPSYIEHHKDKIGKWFEPIVRDNQSYDDNLCIINFRGGEYRHMRDVFLPRSYWKKARQIMLELNPNMIFKVVTDDYKLAAKFFAKSEIVEQQMAYDYISVLRSKYLILSNSSFGWFPGWLNKNATLIIAPKYWWGYNNSEYWSTGSIKTENFSYLDKQGKLSDQRDSLR